MAIEKIVNIRVNDNTNVAEKNIKQLDVSLNQLQGSTIGVRDSMKDSSLSVLENGGAMGLLNDATGGLAMTVKDAVEATALFAKESKIATFIQTTYSTIVGVSTGAMKAFRIALISTGIGALVIGLILLITNFDKVKGAVLNLIPGLKSVGEFIGNIIESVTDFIGVTSEAERAFARLTEQAEKSLAKNKKFLDEQGDQIDEFTKRKIEANNAFNEAIKEQGADVIALTKRQNREIAKIDQDRNDARAKLRKEEQDKINTERQKQLDKAKADRDKQKAIDDKIAEDRKKLAEENLKAENEFIIAVNNAKFEQRLIEEENERLRIKVLDEAVAKKEDDDQLAREKKTADAKKAADEEIEFQKNKDQAIANSKASFNNIIEGLEASGIAKTKAGQVISKAIALTQIGIDSAVAISKASTLANAEGVAAQLAFPTLPGVGTIARVISYASTAASVIGNIARAKQLLSSGGNSSGGVGQGSAPRPPQFNIVGQNSNNQLAQTIGQQQNKPIEAFVVSGNVTNAQSLDRNRINTATFGR